MSVWYIVPSKRPPAQCEPVFQRWRDMGYQVLAQRDIGEPTKTVYLERPYKGYAEAVNALVDYVLDMDSDAEWLVTGGDDILPDPTKRAEEIARECTDHFRSLHYGNESHKAAEVGPLATFGVMQPCGDSWGENEVWARQRYPEGRRRYIERVLGSPWMGREWCRRMYGGNGPLWPEYTHMFEDQEHQEVAERIGVLWQRRDLTHHHNHFARTGEPKPAFQERWTTPEHWHEMETLFNKRKAAGFPGHEPIP